MILKISDLNRVHVLLWSFSQGCFHFESMDDTIKAGLNAYAENSFHQDYIVLGISSDRADLQKLRDELVAKHGRHEPKKSRYQ